MGTRLEGERPRREVSGESRPADTCVWDFRALELWRRTFPLFKPPGGRHSVTAAGRLPHLSTAAPSGWLLLREGVVLW